METTLKSRLYLRYIIAQFISTLTAQVLLCLRWSNVIPLLSLTSYFTDGFMMQSPSTFFMGAIIHHLYGWVIIMEIITTHLLIHDDLTLVQALGLAVFRGWVLLHSVSFIFCGCVRLHDSNWQLGWSLISTSLMTNKSHSEIFDLANCMFL